jgi:hypothetical protein
MNMTGDVAVTESLYTFFCLLIVMGQPATVQESLFDFIASAM